MTNDIPSNIDTYCVLEFQGIVADIPTYDRKARKLEFVARALNRPTLKFVAKGNLAQAFKSLLHKGCFIQAQAVPKPHIEEVGGERCRVLEWECKKMSVLGTRKVNLGAFSDIRILDGLMPTEEDYEDVGFVEPYSFGRFQKKLDKALQDTKERKGETND